MSGLRALFVPLHGDIRVMTAEHWSPELIRDVLDTAEIECRVSGRPLTGDRQLLISTDTSAIDVNPAGFALGGARCAPMRGDLLALAVSKSTNGQVVNLDDNDLLTLGVLLLVGEVRAVVEGPS